MAHECSECGRTCHCNGDIDDIFMGEDPNCNCAYSDWGCGSEIGDDEYDMWDEDDEDYLPVH